MRRFLGALCMLLGLALLAGAAWLLMENRAEESAAGDAAGEVTVSYTHLTLPTKA